MTARRGQETTDKLQEIVLLDQMCIIQTFMEEASQPQS